LWGNLSLDGLTGLEKLCIRQNKIDDIKFGSHPKLTELIINGTLIKKLELDSQVNLVLLNISDVNQLIFLDLSKNINLTSLLVERCKRLERIDGLDRLTRLTCASIKDNPRLNNSDYERFCIADSPQNNIGLPDG
jgi:hypothetical protein